jgi:L-threonylcarbamoyladenylate synthase
VLVYPTETTYGFGCALRENAIARLLQLKRRDPAKPFLLLVGGLPVTGVEWNDAAARLADAFWPGPLTLVLRTQHRTFPQAVLSRDGTVAVRFSPHPGVRGILEKWRNPITSSSANVPGEPAARDAAAAAAAIRELGGDDEVLVLDGGKLEASPPSTLVDVTRQPPRVLRAGAIGTDALRRVLGVIDDG